MDRGCAFPVAKPALRSLLRGPTLRAETKRRVSVKSSAETRRIEASTNVEDLPLPGGTFGLPFVGETVLFLTKKDYVQSRLDTYGPVFKSNLFFSKTVFLNDVDVIEQVEKASPSLVECSVLGAGKKILGPNTLLAQNGPEHAFQRRLLMKAFSLKAIEAYRDAVNIASQETLEEWAEKESFLFVPEVKKYIFGTVANRVIGLPLEKGSISEVVKIFESWFGGLLSFGINLPFTKFRKAMKARETLLDIINQGMDIARANGANDTRALPLLLNVRDEDGAGLSDAQIEDIVLLLLGAGYDTTAAVMIRVLRHLTNHPKVLEKALNEQEEVGSKFGDDYSKESLAAMPYLEAILKETMRLDPPAPIGLRKAVKSFEIDGLKVPKGWQVMYGFRTAMTLNESEWVNGMSFDPERWLRGEASERGAFLSFGTGAHVCIGQFLSMLQMKTFLARLLRGYDFEVENPNAEMNVQAMPEPVDKMPIKITKKNLSTAI
ncbi:hypothetical protein BSKO_02948 [Bryopsis sp. KO-2023]|nr:hypothetical protein BSKO_02948 [Bryopsis sp. KO-2023]